MIIEKDPIVSVRLAALNYMAYLINIDKEKTLKAFLAFTNNNAEEAIFEHSINTAQYLARYNFEALYPYFIKALQFEKLTENLSIIFVVAWLNNKLKAMKC